MIMDSFEIKNMLRLLLSVDSIEDLNKRVYLVYNISKELIVDVFESSPLINSIRLGVNLDKNEFELIVKLDKINTQISSGSTYSINLSKEYLLKDEEDLVLSFDKYTAYTNVKVSHKGNDYLNIINANKLLSMLSVFNENKIKLMGTFNENKGNFDNEILLGIGSFEGLFSNDFIGVYARLGNNKHIRYIEQSHEAIVADIEKVLLKSDGIQLRKTNTNFRI